MLGAALVLNPKIFGLSFIFFFILIFWDGAVGTLVFLFFTLFFSVVLQEFFPIGLFSILALLIILIKRALSASGRRFTLHHIIFDRQRGTKPYPRWWQNADEIMRRD